MSNAEIHDLTDSDREDGKLIISSMNFQRLNYRPGSSGSDNRLRIPIPIKRRHLGQDDYPNFERQYIQNINIPTAAKTESDADGVVQNQDDNYHFLMSLLPYLREVPKNRKMVIRHKLQKVFVEEQERKSVGRSAPPNNPGFNHFQQPFARAFVPDPPQHHVPQTPRHPPPPYPVYKQEVGYNNYVPSATAASMPLQNASASTSTALGDLLVQQQQQQPILQQFAAPTGHQQLQSYANSNSSFSSYAATAASVANNSSSSSGFSSYGATAASAANNANNNNNNNSSSSSSGFSNYVATVAADNNNFSNYSSGAAATATAEVINDGFSHYNSTAADNSTYTYQSAVTGEPQTITYLQ
ncbi:nuclear transcription factor Y subunit gamma-like [Myzus persicae]|uniref:nuclear transcription factor Y subunit gamma-like n=1 Tax=Myzus persicae TaxID=13164 RepID=UPI000B934475|nr:nuclear transcription factor Y subunit gamma-like [Myzus persicae]